MRRRAIRVLAGILAIALLALGLQHWRMSAGGAPGPRPEGAIRVATLNVHYIRLNRDEGRWSVADWERRKGSLDATVRALGADIIAFQEMESFAGGNDDSVNLARAWLLERNPGYRAAAVGDWRAFPSTQPIFYRRDRFEVLEQGWFFFSETPGVIYSRSFDGSYPAFASWAEFRARAGGRRFRVLNLHLDYASRENRRRSTALVAGRVAEWTGEGRTVILAGDLNALSGSRLHRRLEEAGLRFADVPGATFHFDRGLNLFGAIDHVGWSGDVRQLGETAVVRARPGGVWPTDHYPVVVDLEVR